MILKQKSIPALSLLKKDERLYGYIDSYSILISDKEDNTNLKNIVRFFLTCGPKWADRLMKIRDKVVGIFGLKTSDMLTDKGKKLDNIKLEHGEQLDIFQLYEKTDNEVILGGDDNHLDLRVSLLIEPSAPNSDKRKLSITTVVKFNNFFGRLYFLPVRPFHEIIVRTTLKNMIGKLT